MSFRSFRCFKYIQVKIKVCQRAANSNVIFVQHHSEEVGELTSALNEKMKEVRRLKNSFEVIKSQNEELKSQVSTSNVEGCSKCYVVMELVRVLVHFLGL